MKGVNRKHLMLFLIAVFAGLFVMQMTHHQSRVAAQAVTTPTADSMQERREKLMQAQEEDISPPQKLPPQSAVPCVSGFAGPYPCSKIDLMAFLPLGDIGGGSGNDIWGWTDPLDGKEYALMGRSSGTSFVDISDPENPIYLGNLPTHSIDSSWRDIKVYNNHAFIVSEASSHGMQVFNLTELRTVVTPPVTFAETAHYTGFGSAHNVAINEDSGYAYAVGTSTCSGGLHMIDISNPLSPAFAGCYSGDGYTHDTQCVIYNGPDSEHQGKEICFNSNEDTLTIVDVSNKSGPILLSSNTYPGVVYTHQGWLTEDHSNFLLGDEGDEIYLGHNTRTYLWNLNNLDAPILIGNYTATTPSIDHNMYVNGSFVYQSNYTAGLRILDASGIGGGSLVEKAYFDIYPVNDNPNFNGTWSNYPYFDSGIVIVSGIDEGLFVLQPHLGDIELDKTVGTEVDNCAITDNIEVISGTEVTYCYTVTNNGDVTLPLHDLVDSELGTLLDGEAYDLEPGISFSYLTSTVILTDTINSAIWRAYVDDQIFSEASDSAVVMILNPDIEFEKTIGTQADTCAETDSLYIPSGSEVTYCYRVMNIGDVTLPLHDLVDSELGILLDGQAYDLEPGMSFTYLTTTVILTDTVNNAIWTAYVDDQITAEASDSASVNVVNPSVELDVTVGTDPITCAEDDSITVLDGMEVTYCYTISNIGDITLPLHDLVDSELGMLLDDFPYELMPGASKSLTATAVITNSSVNISTWTAFVDNLITAAASDITTVTVDGPSIELNMTVGTKTETCAVTDSIEVFTGTEATYCYQVTNAGEYTLTVHDLVDSELGVLLDGFVFELPPGASTMITAETMISGDTFSSATWTAYIEEGGEMATSSDSATVIVLAPEQIYLPFIQKQ